LAKSHIETLFAHYGGLPHTFRKLLEKDPETTDEERFDLDMSSDALIGAIIWTLLLITCLIGWPVVLLWLVYSMIVRPDMTEFEEMFK
jgi:hypothetical protein